MIENGTERAMNRWMFPRMLEERFGVGDGVCGCESRGISTLIPVLVTGAQPPRVHAAEESFQPKDLG
ncbi:hypothetical protein EXN61_14915 [Agrobacterium tumefaciens]|uniref:Uncharacterized protein n=1 Tax=Agrobacterium tumefaciens TaxID=358 RepID=A0A546Y0C8_AGRTU|nr:hypothetical protein EXN61_14915 [Agrobacterium tumefaciens]